MPLDEGCKLSVTLPSEFYQVDDPEITSVAVQIDFAGDTNTYTTSDSLVLDGTNNLFTIDDICDEYINDGGDRYITINSLL